MEEAEILLRNAMEHHGAAVYRLALCRMQSVQDAEDVYQDVFLRLLGQEASAWDGEHLRAWLLRCTVNRCHDLHRFRLRRPVLALADLPPYSLLSPDRCPLFHQPEQFADLKELFCLMDRYAAEREPGFQELCQHLMLASLELVRRMAAGRKEDLVTREDSTFGRVARYIDRHYAEDLSIEQLARQFYLSPYHLSHIFRQKTGYSLKQYVLRRRIGEAQMRLVNAQDSVQTISEAVGFADASYFSRIFSKYVGLTPTEYRKFRIGP